ncbi:MAG: cholesterol transport system auxiliary component [Parvibaculaceae bacterium]|jgi:cholesterol transport system auxiliary component
MVTGTQTAARKRTSLKRASSLAALGLLGMSLLSGCALVDIGAGEPARMFVITPVTVDRVNVPHARTAVTIKEPYAAAEVNTPKILYRPSAHEVVYIGNVRWSDTAPVIFQTALIDTFEQSGKFDAVARTGSGLRARYDVQSELREFGFTQQDGKMIAGVDLRVSLVDMHKGRLIAATRFAAEAPSAGKTQDDLILALDGVSDDVMSQLTIWAAQTLSAHTQSAELAGG